MYAELAIEASCQRADSPDRRQGVAKRTTSLTLSSDM